jgi:hypothetical protein
LLWGYLRNENAAEWITDDLLRAEVDFTESSPFSAAIVFAGNPGAAVAAGANTYNGDTLGWATGPVWPTGPVFGGGVASTVLPFVPHWDRLTETVTVRIGGETSGFRRQRFTRFYPQSPARLSDVTWQFHDSATIARFIRFWQDHSTTVAFAAPGWATAAPLVADVAAGDTAIPVTDTGAIQAGDWLWFQTQSTSGPASAFARVQATAPGLLTLAAATGIDCPAASTSVMPLLAARFDAPQLELTFTHPALAIGRTRVRELPPELDLPSGETASVTLGGQPGFVYLLTLSISGAGSAPDTSSGLLARWTPFEADVTVGGSLYQSVDLSFGALRRSLNLERDQFEFTCGLFPGNPLLPLALLQSESPVSVTAARAPYSPATGAGDPVLLFTGEITRCAVEGRMLTVTCTPGGQRFAQQLPRFLRSPLCNRTLFHDGCGLRPEDWRFSATVAPGFTNAFPFALDLRALSSTSGRTPAWFVHWFAQGWLEWTAPGSSVPVRRAILASTVPVPDSASSTLSLSLTVTLARGFTGPLPAVGDVVFLYPGCDQLHTTCQAYDAVHNPTGKFDNYLNFGGHPFTPAGNPTLVKRSSPSSGGKK